AGTPFRTIPPAQRSTVPLRAFPSLRECDPKLSGVRRQTLMRKWLVRGLVFSVVVVAAAAVWLYQHWANPTVVRQVVVTKLAGYFNGANITLDSAHMRLLGGIDVSELHLSRRDDVQKADFLYVPAAVIYHDKEHVLNGKLGINKIELNRPRLR